MARDSERYRSSTYQDSFPNQNQSLKKGYLEFTGGLRLIRNSDFKFKSQATFMLDEVIAIKDPYFVLKFCIFFFICINFVLKFFVQNTIWLKE